MKAKLLLTLFIMSIYSHAMAISQTLTEITVTEENYKMKLDLVLDDKSDIKKFKLLEIVKGKVIAETVYGTDGAADGIVLMQEGEREVVKLISRNFTEYNGGNVKIDYLYNGINGKRKALAMDLSRDGDTWGLYVNGKLSKRLHFIKNKKALIGVIGIKEIEVK